MPKPLCSTLLALLLSSIFACYAGTPAEADKHLQDGLQAMREADAGQAGDGTIVKAAVALIDAKKAYEQLKDFEMVREVNSYLFWCKKKMTNKELDMYLAALGKGTGAGPSDAASQAEAKREAEAAVKEMTEIATQKVSKDDAANFLASADTFANKHGKDPFRVHVRYLEVAERFADSDVKVAIEANKKSTEWAKKWAEEVKKESETVKQEIKELKAARALIFEQKEELNGSTPIPDRTQLRDSQKILKDTYASKLAQEDKAELGRYLLKEAKKSKDEANLCFALATAAVEAASDRKALDLYTVINATAFIGKHFKDYDIDAARASAYKSMSKVGTAAETLMHNPTDPAANKYAGMSLAFVSGELKMALPMLALADDDKIKRVAEMEITGAKDANQKKQIADLWLDISSNREFREIEIPVKKRALSLYRDAAEGLNGASAAMANKNIAELEAIVPLDLSEVDLKKLTEKQWLRIRGANYTVDARKIEKTGIKLAPGQKAMVIPCPSDRWMIGYGTAKEVDWKGYNYYSSGRAPYGHMVSYLGRLDTGFCKAMDVMTGPGEIWLTMYKGEPGNTYYSSGDCKGTLRVKVVPIEE